MLSKFRRWHSNLSLHLRKLHREFLAAKYVNANSTKIEGLLEETNRKPPEKRNADEVLLNNLGAACWVKGDMVAAVGYFESAASADEQFEEALSNCASAYYELGEIQTQFFLKSWT